MPSDSRPRQNYHKENENELNKVINLELTTSYVYQSMSFYFDRDDVALRGFHKFFKEYSEEERENAEKLMKYQNKRGGRVALQPIKKPDRDEWGSAMDVMKKALAMEKNLNQAYLDLHKVAESHKDAQMMDYLESEYLGEKVESIKKICDYITNIERVGFGHGIWHFDRELQS